jgi:hypothetical protein
VLYHLSETWGNCTGIWSQGRHFRIASRDVGKSTADSYISAYFNIGRPEKQEYIGQIDQIMTLNYDSIRLVLIKAKWYKNNVTPWRDSTTLVQDECGMQRVLVKEFMPDHLVRHEPFVFPEQCNQVFLVPDRLHEDWKLVVDTEVRRDRPNLPMAIQEVSASGPGTSRLEEEADFEGPSVGSDSEGETDVNHIPSTVEEGLYPEEIITYKRRPRNRFIVENHVLEGTVEEDVLSDDEATPDMEDFPEIEA